MASRLPRTLYHYCSVQTFFNIIKNRSIWLSDVSKTNDSQELRWILGELRIFMMEQWLVYVNNAQAVGKTVDFERFNETYKIIDNFLRLEIKKNWVFCLSERKDDLGQWRGYADDGKGVALGFRANNFYVMDSLALKADDSFDFCFRKIEYGRKKLKAYFDSLLENVDLSSDRSSDGVIADLLRCVDVTLDVAGWYKNDGFREEKEWRLIYKQVFQRLLQGNLPETPSCIQPFSKEFRFKGFGYSPRGNDLVSHVEFYFENLDKFLSNIIIGPKCKLSPNEVYLFLISCGIIKDKDSCKIKVERSASSYR